MIFLVEEKEKKKFGVGFLSKCRRGGFVAGEGLSWGGFVAGVRLSLGYVCRWGTFVVGWVCRREGLSRGGFVWGGFVAGRVCRREGLSGVGLSVYQILASDHQYVTSLENIFS